MSLRSIGVRLTLWYTAAFAVGFAVLGAAVWFGVQRSLYQAIDETLLERAAGIERFIHDHKTRAWRALPSDGRRRRVGAPRRCVGRCNYSARNQSR